MTLNLLVSLNGAEYFDIVDGATNTPIFLNFFFEAAEAVNMQTGRPALEVGDIVVLDNLAVHQYDGGQILEEYLTEMGIELLFTPTNSPDLNPVEMCFWKVKTKLNGELVNEVHKNLKLSVMDAIESITPADMIGYYSRSYQLV